MKGIDANIKKVLSGESSDKKLCELIKIIDDNKQIIEGEKNFEGNEEDRKFFRHIIIFTDKVSTANYLEKELGKKYKDECVFRVTGELFESEKLNRLQQYKDVKGDISILIITNVACEGQDMDFGNTIINYDLDYNPVRLEQRRGRIDRFTVNKDEIYIHNFAIAEFDYDPENPSQGYDSYSKYSKVKKIFDKIELIRKTTGVFYEILLTQESYEKLYPENKSNVDVGTGNDENMKDIVKNVYEQVLNLVSPDRTDSDVPVKISDLKAHVDEKILMSLGTDNRKYENVYQYVSELLKGQVILVDKGNKETIQITVDRKNQDFLSNVFHGGTLISHIINRGNNCV